MGCVGIKKVSHVNIICGYSLIRSNKTLLVIWGSDLHRDHNFSKWDMSIFSGLLNQVSSLAERTFLLAKNLERLTRLQTLFELSEQCSQLDNERELLKQVITKAVATISQADSGSIHMLDGTKNFLSIRAWAGYQEKDVKYLKAADLRVGQGFAGKAVQSKININVRDFYNELPADGLGNILGVKSSLIIPMIVKGNAIGTINIDSRKKTHAFNEADEFWVETLANQIAMALDWVRLFNQQESELMNLHSINVDSLGPGTTLQDLKLALQIPAEIYRSILTKAVNQVGAEIGNIRVCDYENNELITQVFFPEDIDVNEDQMSIGIYEGVIGKVVRSGESVLALNSGQLQKMGYVSFFKKEIQSEIAIPIRIADKIVGVINIESTKENAFTARDSKALERLSAAIGSYIERYILGQKQSDLVVKHLSQNKQSGIFIISVDGDLRVSSELIPSFLSQQRSSEAISFSHLGGVDENDLLHQLQCLCNYIQMGYLTNDSKIRIEWFRWAKRLGKGFMKSLKMGNTNILAFFSSAHFEMQLEEILIKVNTNREHLFLPFELLYIDENPLVIEYPLVRSISNVVPYTRYSFAELITKTKDRNHFLKVLLVGADFNDAIFGSNEVKIIERELNTISKRLGINLIIKTLHGKNCTIESVEKILLDGKYDIVHFATEGSNKGRPDNYGLVFPKGDEDTSEISQVDILTVRKLTQLILKAKPYFVYLSLCRGARTGSKQAFRSGSFLGIMDSLIYSGVPAVLGFRWDVTDDGARKYAHSFYKHVLEKKSLEYATYMSRRELYFDDDMSETWISPILVNQNCNSLPFW